MRASSRRLLLSEQAAKSVSGKWVARATRPFRSATRRPEDRGAFLQKARLYRLRARSPFRPARRRAGQASGLLPRNGFPATHEPNRLAEHRSGANRRAGSPWRSSGGVLARVASAAVPRELSGLWLIFGSIGRSEMLGIARTCIT